MLIKFAVILALICLMMRWGLGKWPWQYLDNRPARSRAVLNARKLLKTDQGASREQILAAHKRLIAAVHPDRGGSNAQVHEANDARDLLLGELPGGGPKPAPAADPDQTGDDDRGQSQD